MQRDCGLLAAFGRQLWIAVRRVRSSAEPVRLRIEWRELRRYVVTGFGFRTAILPVGAAAKELWQKGSGKVAAERE